MTGPDGIRTDRLVLRPLAPEDLDAFAAIYAQPEVVRFLGDGSVGTREETAEWLEGSIRRNEHEGCDMRSVLLADGEALIGRCGIMVWDIEGAVERELGYLLAREHWGRGYATEAATAMRDHAFGPLGLRRLIALIQHGNEASKAVARRVGMAYERDVGFHGRTLEMFSMGV